MVPVAELAVVAPEVALDGVGWRWVVDGGADPLGGVAVTLAVGGAMQMAGRMESAESKT